MMQHRLTTKVVHETKGSRIFTSEASSCCLSQWVDGEAVVGDGGRGGSSRKKRRRRSRKEVEEEEKKEEGEKRKIIAAKLCVILNTNKDGDDNRNEKDKEKAKRLKNTWKDSL